jgi:hypothetical protein
MSERGDRGWRFVVPGREEPSADAGLQLTPVGAVEMVAGDEAVRQSLLLLLATTPGERVMRPGYGCDLERLVFSPNDGTAAGLAIHYVRQAIETWEPRAELLHVDAGPAEVDPARLDITVSYRVRATQQMGDLGVSLRLDEGLK